MRMLITKGAMVSTIGALLKKKQVLKKHCGRLKKLTTMVFCTLNSIPYRIRTTLAISMRQAMRCQYVLGHGSVV